LGMMVLRERLRIGQWLGLTLGLAGVALVVGEAALESPARFQGSCWLLSECWALLRERSILGGSAVVSLVTRSNGAVPVSRRRGLAGGVAAGNPSCGLDGDCCRSGCMEHRHGFSRRHGPLLRDARSGHRRPRQRKLLSRPRHGGAACVDISRRAT
jgi:hypothetical protein